MPWKELLVSLQDLLRPVLTWFAGFLYGRSFLKGKNLDAVRDAKDIRNRLDTDPAYRKRVRDLFKRR